MPEDPSVTVPGTVEKIIRSPIPGTPEKAQISLESADHLYREVRIENTLTDESGGKVRLSVGSPVEVTITAKAESTTVHSSAAASQTTPTTPMSGTKRL